MKQKTEQPQAEKADKEMEDNRARSRSQRAAREKVNEEKRKKRKEKENEEKLKKETLKKESKKTKKKKRKLETDGEEESYKRRKEGENSPTSQASQDSSLWYAKFSSASFLQLLQNQPGTWETHSTRVLRRASLYIETNRVANLCVEDSDQPVEGKTFNVGMTSANAEAYSTLRRYSSPSKETLYFIKLPPNLTYRKVLVLEFALRKYLEEAFKALLNKDGESCGYSPVVWLDNGFITEHLGTPNCSLQDLEALVVRTAVKEFCKKFKAEIITMAKKEKSEDKILDLKAEVLFFLALVLCFLVYHPRFRPSCVAPFLRHC